MSRGPAADTQLARKPGVARRSTLDKEALVKLGAERLAELALDEAERNSPFMKLVMGPGETDEALAAGMVHPAWAEGSGSAIAART